MINQIALAIVASIIAVVSTVAAEDLSIDHNWTKVANTFGLGQATGVGVDSHNHVFLFHRADRIWADEMPTTNITGNTVIMLDGKTGQKLSEWGGNLFVMPHGLSVDADDNIWMTDVGSHTVRKFSHAGEHLLTLGTLGVAGNDPLHFNRPADVDFSINGDVFVADGYINTRIVKYSSEGTFIKQWGQPGNAPGSFDLPHGVAVSADNKVYVADRSNSRLQVFDVEGKLLSIVGSAVIGRPFGIALGNNGHVLVIDGGAQSDNTRSVVIVVSNNGMRLRSLDTNFDSRERVLGHDIAVGLDGSIYVVDAWASRIIKIRGNR